MWGSQGLDDGAMAHKSCSVQSCCVTASDGGVHICTCVRQAFLHAPPAHARKVRQVQLHAHTLGQQKLYCTKVSLPCSIVKGGVATCACGN